MGATSSAMLLVSLVLTFLFGLVTYTDACLLDINSIFGQINRLSKKQGANKPNGKIMQSTQREICEKYMLGCCKEAVILHERLNRYFQYVQPSIHHLNFSFLVFGSESFIFQMPATIGPFNERNDIDDDNAVHNMYMQLDAHY